ncbi:MAG: hypothetical protein V3V14_12065 [Saprospiraceae bacterium]
MSKDKTQNMKIDNLQNSKKHPKWRRGKLILKNLTDEQKKVIKLGGLSLGSSIAGAALMSFFHSPFQNSDDLIVKNSLSDSLSDENHNSEGDSVVIYTEACFADDVNDDMAFSEAFKTAREEIGAGGFFEWRNKVYNTYYNEEWEQMTDEQKNEYWDSVKESAEYDQLELLDIEEKITTPNQDTINQHDSEPIKREFALENSDDTDDSDDSDVKIDTDANSVIKEDGYLQNEDNQENSKSTGIKHDDPEESTPLDPNNEANISQGYLDANKDEIKEAIAYDNDGDGYADVVLYDMDEDGDMDSKAVDIDGDMDLDIVIIDSNNDGKFDESDTREDYDEVISMDDYIIVEDKNELLLANDQDNLEDDDFNISDLDKEDDDFSDDDFELT